MSHRQRLLVLALTTLSLCALPASAAETRKVDDQGKSPRDAIRTPDTVKNRIVIQINEDDSKKWNATLTSIRNIQADLGPKNVKITVVAISYGLGMLTADSLTATGVQDALAAGVEFIACGNSMKAQNVAQDDLVSGVGIAKAGYVELMKRQQLGWVYLRP